MRRAAGRRARLLRRPGPPRARPDAPEPLQLDGNRADGRQPARDETGATSRSGSTSTSASSRTPSSRDGSGSGAARRLRRRLRPAVRFQARCRSPTCVSRRSGPTAQPFELTLRVQQGRTRGRARWLRRKKLMARLKSELEVTVSVLPVDARHRSESRPRRLAQRAGARQQARAERRAADPRRRSGAARGDLPAVGRRREDARRRAVATVRRSAQAGEAGADHEADARLRPGLKRSATEQFTLLQKLLRQSASTVPGPRSQIGLRPPCAAR